MTISRRSVRALDNATSLETDLLGSGDIIEVQLPSAATNPNYHQMIQLSLYLNFLAQISELPKMLLYPDTRYPFNDICAKTFEVFRVF